MALYRIADKQPQVAKSAFVAAEATLMGEVAVGERASVWFGAVIRADNEPIHIGEASNLQEGRCFMPTPVFRCTSARK